MKPIAFRYIVHSDNINIDILTKEVREAYKKLRISIGHLKQSKKPNTIIKNVLKIHCIMVYLSCLMTALIDSIFPKPKWYFKPQKLLNA